MAMRQAKTRIPTPPIPPKPPQPGFRFKRFFFALFVFALLAGGVFAYWRWPDVASLLGRNSVPLKIGEPIWEPPPGDGSIVVKIRIDNPGPNPVLLDAALEEAPAAAQGQQQPEPPKPVMPDPVILPPELDALLPPWPEEPADHKPVRNTALAKNKLEVLAGKDGGWKRIASQEQEAKREIAAGSFTQLSFKIVYPEGEMDPDGHYTPEPPQKVQIRLSGTTAEERAVQQTVTIPKEVRDAWERHDNAVAEYQNLLKIAREGVKEGIKDDYRKALSHYDAATRAANSLVPRWRGNWIAFANTERKDAEAAQAEADELAKLKAQLDHLEETFATMRALLNEVEEDVKRVQLDKADGKLKTAAKELAVQLPSIPPFKWHSQEEARLRVQLKDLQNEATARTKQRRELQDRVDFALFDRHSKAAQTSFASFDYESACREAGAALARGPDAILSGLLSQAETAVRLGQVFHFSGTGPVRHMAFSTTGDRVTAIHDDGTASVWNVAKKEPAFPPLRTTSATEVSALSPDGTTFAAYLSPVIHYWDVSRSGVPPKAFTGDARNTTSIALGEDAQGRFLISGTRQATIYRWDPARGEKARRLHTPSGMPSSIAAVSCKLDGKMLAAGTADGAVAFLDTNTADQTAVVLAKESAGIKSIAVAPVGKALATISSNGELRWHDDKRPPVGPVKASSAVFSPSGSFLATGHADGRVGRWDGRAAATYYPVHSTEVTAVGVTDQEIFAAGMADGRVKVWDPRNAKAPPPRPMAVHGDPMAGDPPVPGEEVVPKAVPPGPAGVDFHETFDNVEAGRLPQGWDTTDGNLGVFKGSGYSWLQSSSRGSHVTFTPVLEFPQDFELEVWASLTRSDASLGIFLVGKERNLPITLKGRSVIINGQEKSIEPRYWPVRLRIVRDGGTYHLILENHVLYSAPIAVTPQRIRFELDGNAEAARVFEVMLMQHAKARSRPPLVQWQEDFKTTADGTLPAGWSGSRVVGVHRTSNLTRVVASTKGLHSFATPHFSFLDDFQFRTLISLDGGSKVEIVFEGQGNSPDFILCVTKGSFSRGWTIDPVGAADQKSVTGLLGGEPIIFQRKRSGEGEWLHEIFAGNNPNPLIPYRTVTAYDFRRVVFRIQGGDQESRIYGVSLRPLQ